MNLRPGVKTVFLALVSITALVAALWVGPFLIPDARWDPTPQELNGAIVFDVHKANHPGHFSIGEKISIATKVNVPALFFGERARRINEDWSTFYERTPIGQTAPNFDLTTTDGRRIRLSDFAGQNVALMFVAMTCPPARIEVDRWETLKKMYKDDDVKLIFIYSREQHPGEPGYRSYRQPTNDEEKRRYAMEMSALTSIDVAVDPITEDTLRSYGIVPNAAFVLDRQQRVVFKTPWADSKKIATVLDTLLIADKHD